MGWEDYMNEASNPAPPLSAYVDTCNTCKRKGEGFKYPGGKWRLLCPECMAKEKAEKAKGDDKP